tara:strand:+ start:162 stop:425 length:264 start_codon:yes stop_codon:yes gene_type:complete
MNKVNIDPLMRVVEDRKLMDFWADTLFEINVEEQKKVADDRLAKSISKFESMMRSPNNNGQPLYQSWAVHEALGLRFKYSCRYEYMY